MDREGTPRSSPEPLFAELTQDQTLERKNSTWISKTDNSKEDDPSLPPPSDKEYQKRGCL